MLKSLIFSTKKKSWERNRSSDVIILVIFLSILLSYIIFTVIKIEHINRLQKIEINLRSKIRSTNLNYEFLEKQKFLKLENRLTARGEDFSTYDNLPLTADMFNNITIFFGLVNLSSNNFNVAEDEYESNNVIVKGKLSRLWQFINFFKYRNSLSPVELIRVGENDYQLTCKLI